MNEATRNKYQVSYDLYVDTLKTMIFGFDNISADKLEAEYEHFNDLVKQANERSYRMFSQLLGEKINEELESEIDSANLKETLLETVKTHVQNKYSQKKFGIDGYCLRENLLHCAVHMKRNIEILGFISELIEDNSRFVMVDFGDASGAVKIDIDELVVAERY